MAKKTLPSGNKRIENLTLRGIVKRFPGVLANDHIDFEVNSGEIHALLGENGAGKSTLMKIIYGLYRPDEGEILVNGKPVHIYSPADAIQLGIGMIHQHFMLVESLTVVENVALGLPSGRGLLTDLDRMAERIEELAALYSLKVDPKAYIWQLSVGQQQRVEIIKALYRGAALLILDEPTAVLTPQEVRELFVILRKMAADGHALIFISHKLHEVLEITDRVTVLRDGRYIGTIPTSETTKEKLAQMMVGRPVSMQIKREPVQIGDVSLRLEAVSAMSDRETMALKNISLQVRAGEIVGLAGISGNGQLELAEVVAGLRPLTGGKIFLKNEEITGRSPSQIMEAGLSYIPEERMRDGMIREFTVSENIILREHNKYPFSRSGFLRFDTIRENTQKLVDDFNVKTPTLETPVKNLSGGNIQKIILARELAREPAVLIAAQPTRGLDIGATEYVHFRLMEQRLKGTATLLISEDLDEILKLSDRIVVIFDGEIMGQVLREDATAEKLGLMMAGVRSESLASRELDG
ncbi:MAG: ABC transporter ATP-binding protein [Candidatus Promineifilaceae bacterium]